MICKAFFLLLTATPPIYAAVELGAPVYWVAGGLAFSLAVVLETSRIGSGDRPLASKAAVLPVLSVLCGANALATVLLLSSFYLQGASFNEQFVFHLRDTEVYRAAWSNFRALSCLSILYVLAGTAFPFAFVRISAHPYRIPRLGLAALWIFAALTNAPAISTFDQVQAVARADTSEDEVLVIHRPSAEIEVIDLPKRPKNLVFIYAESLERLYFEHDIFGDVMPRLRKLRSQAIDFSNVEQLKGTEWSIAGLVATQCSVPLRVTTDSTGNASLAAVEHPFPHTVCLGDILAAHGYHAIYMAGTNPKFGGAENFMRSHGFREILGRDALLPNLQDAEYQTGWGLYDDSLIELASRKLEELDELGRPYFLALTTMDTHNPNGHPSASCESFPGDDDPMLNALYCADQVLSGFIEELRSRESFRNTLIVLVSDHLAMRNTLWDTLTNHQQERRLTFFLVDAEARPTTVEKRATHFDIAPTLLDRMGLSRYGRNNLGQSLFANETGFWFETGQNARSVASNTDYLGFELHLSEEVHIRLKGPEIKIGRRRFIPSDQGDPLEGRIFAMAFGEDRMLESFISAKNLKDLKLQAGGRFILALSANPRFNQEVQQADQTASYSYYLGRLDGSADIAEPLWWEAKVAPEQLDGLFELTAH